MVIGIDASRSLRAHKTGVEWYSYHVIKGLMALDAVNKYVLYSDLSVSGELKEALPDNFIYKQCRWPMKSLWTQGALSWELMRRPPDVLFIPASAVPVVHPQRTVATIHDVGFLEFPGGYSDQQLQYLKWSTKAALKTCSKIITISHFSKQELVRHFSADPDKICVTHLGYDHARYTPCLEGESSTVREHFKLESPYLFYSGRLDVRKNIETILNAFQLVRENGAAIDLVLVGPLGYRGSTLVELLRRHPFASSIHYFGWVSEEEKIELLQNAFALVFPSFYEGFGLPVVEAQACGVPVVCSSSSSLPEVGGEGALYFDPHSVGACAGKIRDLLSDEGRRTRLIEKGFINAKRFDWMTTARETHQLLTKW